MKKKKVEWELRQELRYRGVVYSPPGEQVPAMPLAEALELEKQGIIARAGTPRVPSPDAQEIAARIRTAPVLASEFLEADDYGVLIFIDMHRPSHTVLKEILRLAERTPRSLALVQALKLLLDEPLSPAERALVGAAGMN